MKTKKIHKRPVNPFEVDPKRNVYDTLKAMTEISFQGRNLGIALEVWEGMLRDPDTVILFGMAGALVPAGMRRIVAYLIKNRYIDVLVSTGANLFHDLHETLGRYHYIGSPDVDDVELKDLGLDRIYDTYAVEKEFQAADKYISDFAKSLKKGSYSTRQFLKLLGDRLNK